VTRRFVVGQISHETNTFSPIRTELRHFAERGYTEGDAMLQHFVGTKTGIGGYADFARETGAELIPTIAASAVPSGFVAAKAHETLVGKLLAGISSAGRIDGVLLCLHGAMVTEGIPDAEGDILTRARDLVGPNVPVVATLDYHATLTDLMVAKADGLFGYNTYPHIDGYERALEAANYASQLLEGKIKPTHHVVRPPLAPGVVPARTGWGPIKKLMERAFEYEKQPGVLNVSVYGGFVYSDISDAGLAFLATTDNDPALAKHIADDLAKQAWAMRHEFVTEMKTPLAAVRYAMARPRGPIVLADVADNTGGGASGDGTELLRALLGEGAQGAAVITIPDPEATAVAFAAGVGGDFDGMVGGKIDDLHGAPVRVQGKVRLLSDGHFVHRGPMGTGTVSNIGRTAVVVSGGVEIIINERRFQPVDPEAARAVGIDPAHRKMVVLKSAVHYRASYEPIAAEIVEVDGPGLASPNLSRFAFRNIRRPVYPIDADFDWK
jgi:microcystin degradation protein MlrC